MTLSQVVIFCFGLVRVMLLVTYYLSRLSPPGTASLEALLLLKENPVHNSCVAKTLVSSSGKQKAGEEAISEWNDLDDADRDC